MDDYQKFIALSRYARYLPEMKKRETWIETVQRYIDFFKTKFPEFPSDLIFDSIYNLHVMPSMRSLMTAGKALDRDHAAGYNCSAMAVDDARVFDECMYLSMTGCGVGFSVERQFICKLPTIAEEFFPTDTVIHVKDSKIGWASALRELISLLYGGLIPKWDLSSLRPAGAPLKTFGGRSSGPEPLEKCFKFFIATFKQAAGRKLNSIECHDLMCKIGEIVVVGGVRRCRVEDELIQMADGSWKQLNQVTVGENAKMPDGSVAVISNVFDNGIQEVVKLHLEDGSYFECTPEHVWLVFNHDTNLLEEIQTRNLPLGNYSMVFPE